LVHVYTGHTEVEGRGWLAWFEGLLSRLLADGFQVMALRDLAAWVQARDLADPGGFVQGTLPGRAGTVTCQAPLLAPATAFSRPSPRVALPLQDSP
jgi:hypothetical protein